MFQQHWFDWVPLTGAHHVWWSAAIATLLLAMCFGTAFLSSFPGFVPEKPRRLTRLLWIFGTVAYLAPWFCLICAILMLIRPLPGEVVVLSSRARPFDSPRWMEGWTNSVREWRTNVLASAGLTDAGPMVSDICGLLLNDYPGKSWSFRSGSDQQLLSAEIERGFRKFKPRSINSLDAASHGVEPQLPTWVVESVELTTLVGLVERHNVAGFFVQATDRETPIGPAWETFRPLLIHSMYRRHPLQFQLKTVSNDDSVRILQILKIEQRDPSTVAATLALRIPSSLSNGVAEQDVSLELQGDASDRWAGSATLHRATQVTFSQIDVLLQGHGTIFNDRNASIILGEGGARLDQRTFDPSQFNPALPGQGAPVHIGIVNNSGIDQAAFESAWQQAAKSMLINPSLEDWRLESEARQWHIRDLGQIGLNFHEGEVTIEQLPTGLLIRPGWDRTLSEQLRSAIAGSMDTRPIRGKLLTAETPGYYSLRGLPFQDVPGSPLPFGHDFLTPGSYDVLLNTNDLRLTSPRREAELLGWGSLPKDFNLRQILFRIPCHNATNSGTATFILGLNETNSLVPWNSTPSIDNRKVPDFTRAAALWLCVLQAVDLAASPESKTPSFAELAEKEANPVILLDATQRSALQTDAFMTPVKWLCASLAVWSCVAALNRRPRSQNQMPS